MSDPVQTSNDRFNDILERCITAVNSGRVTVEECIARFPEYPELGDLLRLSAALGDLPRPAMPAAFTTKTQQRLQAQFRERVRTSPNRSGAGRSQVAWPRLLWRALAIVAVIVIVIGAGGYGLVRASDQAVPSDGFLYQVKLANENAQLYFADSNTKPRVLYAIAEARIGEVNTLASRRQPVPDPLPQQVFDSVDVALASPGIDDTARNKLSSDALNAITYARSTGSLSATVADPLLTLMENALGYQIVNGQPQRLSPTPSAVVQSSSATPTSTSTATFTPSTSPTQAANSTSQPTLTPSFTPTSFPTAVQAASTSTPTHTLTPSPESTAIPSSSPTSTVTSTPTLGPGPARVLTGIPSQVVANVPTVATVATQPATEAPTQRSTGEATSAGTEVVGGSPTVSAEGSQPATEAATVVTQAPTNTATDTPTDTATSTDTPTSTNTPTIKPTATLTPSRTRRPTRTPTNTRTPTPVPPTATPTSIPTTAPTATPNGLPSSDFKQPWQQITFQNCPPQGDGGDATLNQTRNRVDEGRYQQVTFDALSNLPWPKDAMGKTRDQWSQADKDQIGPFEGLPLTLDGSLVKAQENGPEPQNCNSNDYKTWTLWLLNGQGSANDTSKAIVVGVSPRVRANHSGWTLDKLTALAGNSAQVRVSGWLMFDEDHPDDVGKSRQTPWEIHPAMQIAIQVNGQWVNLDDYHP